MRSGHVTPVSPGCVPHTRVAQLAQSSAARGSCACSSTEGAALMCVLAATVAMAATMTMPGTPPARQPADSKHIRSPVAPIKLADTWTADWTAARRHVRPFYVAVLSVAAADDDAECIKCRGLSASVIDRTDDLRRADQPPTLGRTLGGRGSLNRWAVVIVSPGNKHLSLQNGCVGRTKTVLRFMQESKMIKNNISHTCRPLHVKTD